MGQDYWIVNADKRLILNPLQYDAGGKMFEHCFMGNSYLYELLHLLANEWKGDCVFNSGDYATEIPKQYHHKYEQYHNSILKYEDECGGSFRVLQKNSAEQLRIMWKSFIQQYVFVNYDQKIYCALDCCPAAASTRQICPVPLLLSNSDTIAGGDYASSSDFDQVGSWRYNHVGVELKQWKKPLFDDTKGIRIHLLVLMKKQEIHPLYSVLLCNTIKTKRGVFDGNDYHTCNQ